MDEKNNFVFDDQKAASVLKNISGEIIHVKWDIFKAHPRKNVAEKDKPTPAMKKAQSENIKKAQAVKKAKAKKTKK